MWILLILFSISSTFDFCDHSRASQHQIDRSVLLSSGLCCIVSLLWSSDIRQRRIDRQSGAQTDGHFLSMLCERWRPKSYISSRLDFVANTQWRKPNLSICIRICIGMYYGYPPARLIICQPALGRSFSHCCDSYRFRSLLVTSIYFPCCSSSRFHSYF